jgi:branched-chain amino acid transport system substrate-binding protein
MQNVFRTCFNDAVQGREGAEYAVNVLKLKTVAVLHDSTSYGRPIAETFKNTFESLGGNVLAFEGILRGHKDFRLILSKIKPAMPQLVYFGGTAPEGALIVRQMREIGMQNAYFMSDDGCYNVPDFIEAAGEASDGAYITFTQPKAEQYEAWEKRFMERFGNKPIAFAPQTYDATMAMLMAIETVGNLQDDGSLVIGKRALADTIRSLEFEGASGKVGFTDTGDSRSNVVVWQVQDQEFVIAPGQDVRSGK